MDHDKQGTSRGDGFRNWYGLVLVLLAPVAIFAPVLIGDRSLAFRDTAVFYYPLFEWIEEQWRSGTLPLWNPHVNFGSPLAGEASSQLFYPGKLMLLLPLEFSWKFKLYVVAHVMLAAGTAYYAARRFGASREAAALAAVAYACGGAVLFQYCNLVYLVGPAWLPLAFAATEMMLIERSLRAAAGLGVVLALMILGGDAQMAYHAGLAATGYAALLGWSQRKADRQAGPRFTTLLSVAAGTGFLLAAIQILPAMEATGYSDRAIYDVPRSIYEAAGDLVTSKAAWTRTSQGLLGDPAPGTHAAAVYEFSWGPWHLVEYVWPGVCGTYFPQNRRWTEALPAESRIWTPSVYAGLLPALLAVASLRVLRGSLRDQWLSWCAVLAIVGSFGIYGLGWLLRELLLALGVGDVGGNLPGNQVGGLYWLFVTFLPAYVYFRFPAKLLTFAAWPICLLAAGGLDALHRQEMPRLQKFLVAFLAVSGALALIVLLGENLWSHIQARIAPDAFFGPFDPEGARRELVFALLHTIVVGALLLLILRQRAWAASRQGAFTLVAITTIEIVIANSPLVATAPSSLWREKPLLAEAIANESIRPTVRPLEDHYRQADANGWQTTSSPLRIEELAAADRQAMNTYHCLAGPIDSVDSLTSLRLADHTYFYKQLRTDDDAYWGNYRLIPEGALPLGPPWQRLKTPDLTSVARVRLYQHRQPFPRAWIVHEVLVLSELPSGDRDALIERGRQIVDEDGAPRDFNRQAVIESDSDISPRPQMPDDPAGETWSILEADPNRVVIDATPETPGLLVLGDVFYPGWVASVDGEPVPILRTNRMFRGVSVDAGQHRITFEYHPWSLYIGACISGIGWVGLLVFLVQSRRIA